MKMPDRFIRLYETILVKLFRLTPLKVEVIVQTEGRYNKTIISSYVMVIHHGRMRSDYSSASLTLLKNRLIRKGILVDGNHRYVVGYELPSGIYGFIYYPGEVFVTCQRKPGDSKWLIGKHFDYD